MHPLPPPLSLLLSQAALGAPAGCSGCRCPPSSRPGALLGGMRQPEDLQGCPVCVPISCPHVHPVTITFLFHPVLSLAPHNNCPSSAQTCPASPPIPVPSPPRPCLCSHSYHRLTCIPRIPSNLVQFQMFPWQLCHTVGHLLRVCLQWDEGTPCVPGSAALPAHGTPGAGNPEDPSVTPLGPSQTLQAPQPIPPQLQYHILHQPHCTQRWGLALCPCCSLPLGVKVAPRTAQQRCSLPAPLFCTCVPVPPAPTRAQWPCPARGAWSTALLAWKHKSKDVSGK